MCVCCVKGGGCMGVGVKGCIYDKNSDTCAC